MSIQYTSKDVRRFWSKVKFPKITDVAACWEWQASRLERGYGRFRIGHKLYLAHRVAYELTHSPIGDGLDIMHTCDNPSCCRPSHLFVGSHTDNMRDMVRKGRQIMQIHPERAPFGENNGMAKLSTNDIRKIRKLHNTGVYKQTELADLFKVSPTHISNIIRYKRWVRLDLSCKR